MMGVFLICSIKECAGIMAILRISYVAMTMLQPTIGEIIAINKRTYGAIRTCTSQSISNGKQRSCLSIDGQQAIVKPQAMLWKL